ncbi:MAG: RCC1-like domain-containing protein [Limisphaerales bacterium]
MNAKQIFIQCCLLGGALFQSFLAAGAVAGGNFHSLCLASDGSLWAMGQNVDGLSEASTNQPEQIRHRRSEPFF